MQLVSLKNNCFQASPFQNSKRFSVVLKIKVFTYKLELATSIDGIVLGSLSANEVFLSTSENRGIRIPLLLDTTSSIVAEFGAVVLIPT